MPNLQLGSSGPKHFERSGLINVRLTIILLMTFPDTNETNIAISQKVFLEICAIFYTENCTINIACFQSQQSAQPVEPISRSQKRDQVPFLTVGKFFPLIDCIKIPTTMTTRPNIEENSIFSPNKK